MTYISKASSRAASPSFTAGRTTAADREIQALMKQKSNITEKIAEIKTNEELNVKVKEERVKSLTTDLQLIESQIAQKMTEKNEKLKNDASSNRSNPNSNTTNNSSNGTMDVAATATMNRLIEANTIYDRLGKLSNVRNKLDVEVKDLNREVKMNRKHLGDEGLTESAFGRNEMRQNAELTVNKKKLEQAIGIEGRIAKLDGKMKEEMKAISEVTENKEATGTKETKEAKGDKADKVDNSTAEGNPSDKPAQQQEAGRVHIDVRV
ncbi:FlxA-like family protein [Paenibacillus sp. 481]|uniref:FlxA-like family protein n=1 Tax=Paenibacillus sp. 481 TaxID=2835869 RepID=UPI001E2A09B3|nr:FlxA-like family protein [Paenibacillus sp. 481]UHA71891.1 FlxA-like family protein [Paenibacillus sp. 481]